LLLALLLATLPASAADWQVYTHSLGAQASTVDGSLRGQPHGGKRAFYVELVRALLGELGQPQSIVEVPLARGLKLVQSRNHVVLFNLSRTEEREHLVHWVGPTLHETDYLYELSVRPTGIRAWPTLPACRSAYSTAAPMTACWPNTASPSCSAPTPMPAVFACLPPAACCWWRRPTATCRASWRRPTWSWPR